jgi:RNA polymerase sigma-54 factor
METRLELRQRQQLVMTPQLQLAIKLLQLNRLELEQTLEQEVAENPVLEDLSVEGEGEQGAESAQEEESPPVAEAGEAEEAQPEDLRLEGFAGIESRWEEYFEERESEGLDFGYTAQEDPERPTYDLFLTRSETLSEHLLWQLRLSHSSEITRRIGEFLIGNLDEDGYLSCRLDEIAHELGVKPEEVREALALIQSFDPPGVGACDLRDCLLIQVRHLGLQGTIVHRITDAALPLLAKRRYAQIARSLGVSVEEVMVAVQVIQRLEPKPGRSFSSEEQVRVTPDAYVVKRAGGYQVVLNDDGLPRLRMSPFYKQMLRERRDMPSETRTYLEERYRSALWLIKSIEQRNRTILRVAESIVKHQEAFLDGGVAYLRPLVLRDVAEVVGLHESTVSRVTKSKYMHTPQGLFEFKYFFSTGLSGANGEEVSAVSVRDLLRRLIAEENLSAPWSDQQLGGQLRARGIRIARRTIAKYREELRIPPAYLRRAH